VLLVGPATMMNSRLGAFGSSGAALFVALLLATAVLPTTVHAQSCGTACGSNGCAVGASYCP
jgi:hypothetical protein